MSKEKTPLQKLVEKEGYGKIISFDDRTFIRDDLVKKMIKLIRKEERC